MKALGGVKLSMPVVELLIHAVEGAKVLCAEAGEENREGGGTTHLTPQGLDVSVDYSAWECMEMLLGYLPLYKDLFSLVMTTFRKIQAHVCSGRREGGEGEGGGRLSYCGTPPLSCLGGLLCWRSSSV